MRNERVDVPIVVNTVSKATVSVENASTCDGFVVKSHRCSSSGMYLSRYSAKLKQKLSLSLYYKNDTLLPLLYDGAVILPTGGIAPFRRSTTAYCPVDAGIDCSFFKISSHAFLTKVSSPF